LSVTLDILSHIVRNPPARTDPQTRNRAMAPTFKELTDFFVSVGADKVPHTEGIYLAHAIGVYNDLKSWGCDEDVCRAGLFHSVYGTEHFQKFTLPLERRGEVRELIGERAERLAFANCLMDRSTLDASARQSEPPYVIRNRVTGEQIELSEQDFDDLCTIHLCDWIEQIPRSKAWEYRTEAYGQLATRLGGVALKNYKRVLEELGVADRVAAARGA